jgi:outer membrane protein
LTSLSAYRPSGEKTTFDPALASYRNGVGSITDLNVLSTQLLQAKKASTDVYSVALAGGGPRWRWRPAEPAIDNNI